MKTIINIAVKISWTIYAIIQVTFFIAVIYSTIMTFYKLEGLSFASNISNGIVFIIPLMLVYMIVYYFIQPKLVNIIYDMTDDE